MRLLRKGGGKRPDLVEVGRQVLIAGDELEPPLLNVGACTPGQVGGEIFGVDLPPCPVRGDRVQGHALDRDDQDGLAAVSSQRGLNGLSERRRAATLSPRLVRLPGCHQQPARGLARFHAPSTVPTFRLEVKMELSAGAEAAFYLAVPPRQSARIGNCRPQALYIRVVAVFNPHGALAIC